MIGCKVKGQPNKFIFLVFLSIVEHRRNIAGHENLDCYLVNYENFSFIYLALGKNLKRFCNVLPF